MTAPNVFKTIHHTVDTATADTIATDIYEVAKFKRIVTLVKTWREIEMKDMIR